MPHWVGMHEFHDHQVDQSSNLGLPAGVDVLYRQVMLVRTTV